MLGTLSAHEDQSHFVLCGLGEGDGLVIAAPLALHVLPALQSGVFDALGVHFQVFSSHGEVSSVHAVVHLGVLSGPLVVVAKLALKLEEAALIDTVLLGVEHVVTLRAKAHAFELLLLLAFAPSCTLLRVHHSCLGVLA